MVDVAEQSDKTRVTLISVAAALGLTVLKLVAGLSTGSLGLLSEAAHSGLDLVSSVITYFSVRIAGRPPDAEHHYGHGRVENLAAILQGILLILTAFTIMYESVRRLFFDTVEISSSMWAFVVMFISLGVDLWRSRMLSAAARRYHSRAMEADALNFRADMFSSVVVILGLTLAFLSDMWGRFPGLQRADAAAAFVVALVIIFVSGRMALQAMSVMLDRAPARLGDRISRAAARVPGVIELQQVRLRESGNRLFADVVVSVPRTTSLSEAHNISDMVEASIKRIEPRTEAIVHVEPAPAETETLAEAIRAVALERGIRTHHEQVYRVGDHYEASLHIEVEPEMSVSQAYDVAQQLDQAVRSQNPQLQTVDSHIEVAMPRPAWRREISDQHRDVLEGMRSIVEGLGLQAHCREVRLYLSEDEGWDVVLRCSFPYDLPMRRIHTYTERIEQALRQAYPRLDMVTIQAVPEQ